MTAFLLIAAAVVSLQNDDASRAAKLVQRWSIVMHQQLEESRATATEDTLLLLDEFMSVGAVKAVKDRATESQLRAADRDVKRFVIAMARVSTRQADGSVELDEGSFQRARTALCPLQLFCQE